MASTVALIAQVIEKIAPKAWAEEWDNVGLLVGSGSISVERVLLTLDGTLEAVEEAKRHEAQMIVAHHPIMFRPLKNLRSDNQAALVPVRLLQEGISYYAVHTNLDQSRHSSSWLIGRALGLEKMEFLSPTATENLVKLAVFVPHSDVDKVRQALVKVGVGEGITDGPHSDLYAECFFMSQGTGMFRPLEGAQPSLGQVGELTKVGETKLESVLPERLLDRAIRALLKAHPYEEPAYDIIPLRNPGQARGYGVIGYLPEPENLESFFSKLNLVIYKLNSGIVRSLSHLSPAGLPGIRLAGDPGMPVRKIAIVNGSGGNFVPKALFKGADLFITGDVDHHAALEALEGGMAVADIGHFWSEAPMLSTLAEYLKEEKALEGLEILISSRSNPPWLK